MTFEVYDTSASKVYSYTLSTPRSVVVTEEVVDSFFDDTTKFDDENDIIVPHRKASKTLTTAALSVGISVASIFSAVLFINFLRVKYRKRRSKHRRGSKVVSIFTTPDSALLKYNDYDFEDIEMMNKFRSDMYNIPEDDENDSESLFKTSISSLQPVTSIMVTEVLDTRVSNGIIYSTPKHTRRQTSHF